MKDDGDTLRITQQFRSGQAMVYDLRRGQARLTVRITATNVPDAGPPTEWRIEAATSTSPGAVVVAEIGPTRAAALRAVGREWDRKRLEHDLPIFDWESVAKAMTAVRAL